MKVNTGIQRLAVIDYSEFFDNRDDVYGDIRVTNVNVVWFGDASKTRRCPMMIFERDGKYGVGYFNAEYGNAGAWKYLDPGDYGTIGEAFKEEEFGSCPKAYKDFEIKVKLSDFFDDDTDEPVIYTPPTPEEIEEQNRNFYTWRKKMSREFVEESKLIRDYKEYYEFKEKLGEEVPHMPEFPNMFEIIEYYRINH